MEIREAIRTNGSVRRFTADPVERATVLSILDDARFAPSGGNRQPWRVAIVEDRMLRREMATLMQPVWDEYLETSMVGGTPFNAVDYVKPLAISPGKPNDLFAHIETIPVVLAVAVDLSQVALMDGDLDRPAMTGGASVFPFCWNLLLSARAHGLGGVMTTFLSRVEPAAAPALGLPDDHALVSTIFLGVPEHQPTRLSRHPVEDFATIDRFDGPPASAPSAG
jgi:nitroreductase